MNIINLSDFSPEWCWLKKEFADNTNLLWDHYSAQSIDLPKLTPKADTLKRAIAAYKAVQASTSQPSLLVSHMPKISYFGSLWSKKLNPELPHLAYSFNFTNLPTGYRRKAMAKAFQSVTRFVTYSSDERKLYAEYFDLPIEKIDMQYWSINQPNTAVNDPAVEDGDYICALGSEARDYETLFQAMKQLPNIKLVVVAKEENLNGLDIPSNVTTYSNIPFAKAMNILNYSKLMVLPLRDSLVPCGHGSIVSAMFYKKAIIITDSSGVYDYVKADETGMFYEARNANNLALQITALYDDVAKTERLSQAAYHFVQANCTEKAAVSYLNNFLLNQALL